MRGLTKLIAALVIAGFSGGTALAQGYSDNYAGTDGYAGAYRLTYSQGRDYGHFGVYDYNVYPPGYAESYAGRSAPPTLSYDYVAPRRIYVTPK